MKILDELVTQYGMNKAELDGYKKLCDKENKEIKKIMKDYALQIYKTDDYKVTYNVQQRESLNEEILIPILNAGVSSDLGIVKVKEYVDFDALENAIYNDLIPREVILEMNKAKETKEVETLRISKIKKGE